MAMVLFLLLAFPSAGVYGQDEDQQEDESKKQTTVPNNGGGGEGGEGGGKVIEPRHVLFAAAVKSKAEEAKMAHNYLCMKFDDTGPTETGNREFCGCVSKDASNWKPDKFHYPSVDMKDGCLETFYKVAMMPMCGNEWFDQMKLCALTQFFGDDPGAKIKEDANKKTLLLIDGCAVCSGGGKIQGIKVSHVDGEAGGMFSNCKEEKELTDLDVDDLSIDLPGGIEVNENTGSFSVPVVLQHRRCAELFGYADLSDDFKQIKLEITYTCGGVNGKKTIELPDVKRTGGEKNPFDKFQVAELRGLFVNLDDDNKKQYKPVSGGEDKMPKYVAEDGLGWQNANVQCWFGEGTPCTLTD